MTLGESGPAVWSFAKRLAIRFGCIFFALYFFPFPLDYLPFMDWLSKGWAAMWQRVVIWSGAHVLHLARPIIYEPTGSGDTLHDWVFVGLLIILSAAIAALWSLFGRAKKAHPSLAAWLRVYLRYALAAIMLSYGFSKVFDLQFSPPGGLGLTETYGQSSPMRLAWTFMGYSVAYTVFAGLLECLGGLLLLFRRTTTLGAMLTVVVMTNVVMMNFCYDIPVKLHSSLYLMMALLLLAPSMGRLLDVFLLHRPPAPEDIRPPQWIGWRAWGRRVLKAAFIGYVLISNVHEDWNEWREYRNQADLGSVNGFYEIEALNRNGQGDPGWRWVLIGRTYLQIGLADGTRVPTSRMVVDPIKQAFTLNGAAVTGRTQLNAPIGTLAYSTPDPGHLVLQGALDGVPLEMHLKKKEASDFPLMNRGFHWITEHPYAR